MGKTGTGQVRERAGWRNSRFLRLAGTGSGPKEAETLKFSRVVACHSL